jgi:hypothetical protein
MLVAAVLYFSMGGAIKEAPPTIASALRTLRRFIVGGWTIDPIGFLLALGGAEATKFKDVMMSEDEILGRYSKVMLEFDDYIKMGQGVVNSIMGGGLTKPRVVREKTENKKTAFAKSNWHGGQNVLLVS